MSDEVKEVPKEITEQIPKPVEGEKPKDEVPPPPTTTEKQVIIIFIYSLIGLGRSCR